MSLSCGREHMRAVGHATDEGEAFPSLLKCVFCGRIEYRREKHQRRCGECLAEAAHLGKSMSDVENVPRRAVR